MARELEIRSPSAGLVATLKKREGDNANAGDALMILEVMKMEVPVRSPADGTLTALFVGEGEEVEEGQKLALVEPLIY